MHCAVAGSTEHGHGAELFLWQAREQLRCPANIVANLGVKLGVFAVCGSRNQVVPGEVMLQSLQGSAGAKRTV